MSVLEILGLGLGILILSLIFIFGVSVAIVSVYGCIKEGNEKGWDTMDLWS